MGDDRVVINQFERARSTDINDLQSVSARRVNDLIRFMGARHKLRPLNVNLAFGGFNNGTESTPDNFVCGLEVTKVNDTQYQVNPGWFAAESPPNITKGAFDSDMRVAFLRAVTVRPYPATTAAFRDPHLLSCRIQENITQTVGIEIFDVPTQTFLPATVDKLVEFGLEFREDPGTVTSSGDIFGYMPFSSLPAGQGWEPLAYITVSSNPSFSEHGRVDDVRRDFREIIKANSLDPIPTGFALESDRSPTILRRNLYTVAMPTDVRLGSIQGEFYAQHREQIYGFKTRREPGYGLTTLVPQGEALSANTLTHVWMCPVVSGGLTRAKTGSDSQTARQQGVAVLSQAVEPTYDGRNAQPIVLPLDTLQYGGWDAIPIGGAVHVMSYVTDNSGAGTPRQYVCTGNKQLTKAWTDSSLHGGAFLALQLFHDQPGLVRGTIDLRGLVPNNVRAVLLQMKCDASFVGGGPAPTYSAEVQFAKEPTATTIFNNNNIIKNLEVQYDVNAANEFGNVGEVWLPVWTPFTDDPEDTAEDAYLQIDVIIFSQDGSLLSDAFWDFKVAGWEYAN